MEKNLKLSRVSLCLVFFLSACLASPSSNSDTFSGPASLQIHDLQGCSHSSPRLGQQVTSIQGVVTWKDDQGFFMQDTIPDSQECSSEAIYVFTQQYPSVIPGDSVAVSGKVEEFQPNSSQTENLTLTEIRSSSVKILSSNNLLPVPTILGAEGRLPPAKIIEDDGFTSFDPDSDGIDFYESLEGMRVEIPRALVVGPEDSYHEVFVIPDEMASQNTLSAEGALLATGTDQNPERILVVLPDGYKKTLDLGAEFVQPLIGILSYAYGSYEIIETNVPVIQARTPLAISQPAKRGEDTLRIATYNVENLSRFDDARMTKQATHIVKTLGSPDILVLEEIQDDSGSEDDGVITARQTLQEFVQKIAGAGGPAYTYVDEPPQDGTSGGAQGGNIRTVFLYRVDRGLKLDPSEITLPSSAQSVFANSRIPIVRRFSFRGQNFYLIGVHLVANTGNSPLFGSLQPPQKPDDAKRLAQAKWIAGFAAELKAYQPDAAILIVGDYNDTPDSQPLQALIIGGFVDLAENSSPSECYSILYEGNAFLYDQILFEKVNSHLSVARAGVVHLNTSLAESKQASDHDPFWADLSVN